MNLLKIIFVILGFLVGFVAYASPTFLVQGKQVTFLEYELFEGTDQIDEGQLAKKYVFDFTDGNRIALESDIYLYRSGQIELALNPGVLNYTLADGTKITLDCGVARDLTGETNRLVRFHENGRYNTGCDSKTRKVFRQNGHYLEVLPGARMTLNEKGKILGASSIFKESYIVLSENKKTFLDEGSAIHFYENGAPHFFNLKVGETLVFETKSAEKLIAYTDPENPSIVVLHENGNLAAASIKGDITVIQNEEIHSFKVIAAQFYISGEPGVLFLKTGTVYPDSVKPFVVQLRGGKDVLCTNERKVVQDLNYCREAFRQ